MYIHIIINIYICNPSRIYLIYIYIDISCNYILKHSNITIVITILLPLMNCLHEQISSFVLVPAPSGPHWPPSPSIHRSDPRLSCLARAAQGPDGLGLAPEGLEVQGILGRNHEPFIKGAPVFLGWPLFTGDTHSLIFGSISNGFSSDHCWLMLISNGIVISRYLMVSIYHVGIIIY